MVSDDEDERFTLVSLRRRTASLGFELVGQFAQDANGQGLVQGQIGAVRFDLIEPGPLDAELGPMKPIAVPPEVEVSRNGTGIFAASGIMINDQQSLRTRLTPGRYRVSITSEYYQPLVTDVFQYPAASALEALQQHTLKPNDQYPFRQASQVTLLRGILRDVDGSSIEGARLSTQFASPENMDREAQRWDADYQTDRTGRWVFAVPSLLFPVTHPRKIELTIQVTLPGSPSFPLVRELLFDSDARVSETNLRGRVETPGGLGVRSADVRVAGITGKSFSDRDGQWQFHFPLQPPRTSPADLTVTVGAQSQTRRVDLTLGSTTDVPPFVFG